MENGFVLMVGIVFSVSSFEKLIHIAVKTFLRCIFRLIIISLQLLLHNRKLVNLGEDLLQTIFIEHVRAVNGLNELPGGLPLAETGELNLFPGLQVSFVGAGVHQIPLDLQGNFGLGALFFDVLYVHVVCPPILRPPEQPS